MKLNLSDDLRYICLSCTENKPGSEIHFKAWNAKSLKPLVLNQDLLDNLNTPVEGSILKSIKFIGNSFYALKEFEF